MEQNTLVLDTGNSFFNNRISSNKETLARALTEAVKSAEPLRIEIFLTGSGNPDQTAPLPPLVSEAISVFGSELIDLRKGKNSHEHSKGDS
jgi:hypothetical protein